MKERKRNRKKGFDYSSQGIYFLTICCKDRINHFGKIYNRKMELNEFGNILNRQIEWMEQQYPYFIIHNYIIMPNHIHILAEISRDSVRTGRDLSKPCTPENEFHPERADSVRTNCDLSQPCTPENEFHPERADSVRTGRDLSLQSPHKIKSISELMGALKTTSSKKIHLAGNTDFQWQRSFHDHIVKSENAYWNIYNYITQNPEKWENDTFNNLK